jgi:membrane fusion protein (multidrug efflux system)
LFKRHFFLISALALILIMGVAGGLKLAFGGDEKAGGGGPGGAPGAQAGKGGGRGGPGGGRASQVEPATVAVRTFSDTIEALGEAKARQSVTITSSTTEMITRVLFSSGQFVRQGQVLVELKADEQNAEVLRAQATVNQAKRENDRWQELARRGIAPRATAEQYQAAYEQAVAGLRAEQARRGDRVIRAPFSGQIGLSDAAPGLLVNPGTPIATLDDLSVIHVDFDVPERYLPVVRQGAAIEARADAIPGSSFIGRISRLDTRVDPATRAITARAEIPNPSGTLKPGMLLRVSIAQGQRQSAAAPEAAVQFEGDTAYVYKIAEGPRGTVAQRQTVRAGSTQGGFVEILEGLTAGERIVANGTNRVQPNAPIQIAGAGGPGARRDGGAAGQGARGAREGAGAP